MNTINITSGSSHRIQIVLTRYGLPMAVTQSSNVEVSVEKVSLGRKIILERTLSATREGVLECVIPAILTAGRYNLTVTGDIEGEGSWRMSAPSGIKISDSTEKGDEKLTVQGDSFDVTAEVTVMQGTSGSEEELRERIAEIVQEEYNASEQIREQNEAARQEAEEQREIATALAVEGAERVNAELDGSVLTVTDRNGNTKSINVFIPDIMSESDVEEMMGRVLGRE